MVECKTILMTLEYPSCLINISQAIVFTKMKSTVLFSELWLKTLVAFIWRSTTRGGVCTYKREKPYALNKGRGTKQGKVFTAAKERNRTRLIKVQKVQNKKSSETCRFLFCFSRISTFTIFKTPDPF